METQTMVRVNCQNGDGGGSWVGHKSYALYFRAERGVAAKLVTKAQEMGQGSAAAAVISVNVPSFVFPSESMVAKSCPQSAQRSVCPPVL